MMLSMGLRLWDDDKEDDDEGEIGKFLESFSCSGSSTNLAKLGGGEGVEQSESIIRVLHRSNQIDLLDWGSTYCIFTWKTCQGVRSLGIRGEINCLGRRYWSSLDNWEECNKRQLSFWGHCLDQNNSWNAYLFPVHPHFFHGSLWSDYSMPIYGCICSFCYTTIESWNHSTRA